MFPSDESRAVPVGEVGRRSVFGAERDKAIDGAIL